MRSRRLLAALAAAALVVVPVGPSWSALPSGPGSAGTDTSLPATESKVTVAGRGRFKDLNVTVNQTRDLVNQAVSVTWTGGTPTKSDESLFDENYLQLFQCWGDDDGLVPDNPGPPPEQCQQGASEAAYARPSSFPPGGDAPERVISRPDAPNFEATKSQGFVDEKTGRVWKPFRPVDGPIVNAHIDYSFSASVGGGDYWLNPYFNIITTNEIAGARTGPNGTGAELFEATTGLESTGLGCGQKVQAVPDGSKKVPRCWLVVVPRGSAADENVGSSFATKKAVLTSPLSPDVWRNRIAIPLEFNPVETSCPISADQRQLVGSELLAAAVASWQPALCATPGLPPYSFGSIGDSRARDQLLGGQPGAPGLAVGSRPLDPAMVDPQNPPVYAPLSLSGTVIGFNIERVPKLDAPPEEQELAGVRVAQINLTPRLAAKLLSQSYRNQVEIKSVPPYTWSTANPQHLELDPDFRQFNPEFDLLNPILDKNLGGLLLTGAGSDAARQVWEWVLSDPEAKAWLDGSPDPWGMKVNPVYATTDGANPSGTAFGTPVPDTYPKSDPYCYKAPPFGPSLEKEAPPLCGIDWNPYTQSLRDAARLTRAANDGSRTVGDQSALSGDKYYKPSGPDRLGSRAILSITDSASAAQYGLQTARLSRSGDNGPDRAFVAPEGPGFQAGVKAMAARAEPAVLEPKPDAGAGAYPLTALTYAALTPRSLDEKARQEYAAFVAYAAGPGQEPGRKLGQLPPGYASLPDDLRAQGLAAVLKILDPGSTSPPIDGSPTAGGQGGSTPSATEGPGASVDPGPASAGEAAAGTPPAVIPGPEGPKSLNPVEKIVQALRTPIEHLAGSRFLLPGLVAVAMLASLGALEITKRSRRAGRTVDELPAVQPGDIGATNEPGMAPDDAPPPGSAADTPRVEAGSS